MISITGSLDGSPKLERFNGIAVMGGMLAATFLAIFFVPMFYIAVENIFHGKRKESQEKHEFKPAE
jgi:multidrug efflux pump subunit AcrB